MTILPIVERELRVTARQWRMYWGRSVIGAAALLAVIYIMWLARMVQGTAVGPILLRIFSHIALCFAVFSGVTRTADCISSEKREDTLGLLVLTNLRAHDIILGKLVAGSLYTMLFLLSTLPILSIPVMIGGVSARDLVCLPISLANALLFSLSIGILTSTLLKVQRQAMLWSSVAVVVLAVLLPALGLAAKTEWNMRLAPIVLSFASPFFAHELSFNATFGLSKLLFWWAIGIQFSISIACIVASCLILPNAWRIKSGEPPRWKTALRQWWLGSIEDRRRRRGALLERNPILWLGARERLSALLPFLFMAVCYGGALWAIAHYGVETGQAWFIFFFCCGIIDFYFRARVATLGATIFGRERQMGTWEMILSTPLSVREILRGNRMAVRRSLISGYAVFLTIYATGLITAWVQLSGVGSHLFIGIFFGILSAAEFVALGYFSMWRGMRAHSPLHAPSQALLRITVLPWLFWLLLLPLFQQINFLRVWFDESTACSIIATTSVLWLLSTVTALRTARKNLLLHFRDPASAPSFWLKLLERSRSLLAGMLSSPTHPVVPPCKSQSAA